MKSPNNQTNNQISESSRTYVAIDLKSFYASVECVERGFDPLTTNLVVADESRTDKTICLAVSPSLKSYGIPGRCRLFEVKQKIKEVNANRRARYGKDLQQEGSTDSEVLTLHPEYPVDFVIAPPRLSFYMDYSTKIYDIYLNYIAPEDIHIYSIDEVFMDVTDYLSLYGVSAHELTMKIIRHVLKDTGITATAGIGSNLYLAKIAMDIEAKHCEPDEYGVRIAELDEFTYRKSLWNHKPITDFWRVGRGYAKKLAAHGIYTMGDVARCSIGGENDFYNEDLLYRLFGINAELLIDHAWGWEPCTIEEIKAYVPDSNSISSGQVLQKPYSYEKAELIVKEMVSHLALDMVAKKIVTNQVSLSIGYDIENIQDPERQDRYQGAVEIDHYGRRIPKQANGTANLDEFTNSEGILKAAFLRIFREKVNPDLLVRRVTVGVNNIKVDGVERQAESEEQMDFFGQIGSLSEKESDSGIAENRQYGEFDPTEIEEEKVIQETLLAIKEKFGNNAVVKALDLEEDATGMERNRQIGGHKA